MENEAVFMSITSVEDPQIASQFLEMAGGNLEHAVSLFFEHGAGIAETSNQEEVTPSEPEESDAQMAERLQQEMYQTTNGNAAANDDFDEFGVRRPIEPTRETLIPQEFYGHNVNQFITPQQSMFGASQRGIFNQTSENSIIELNSDDSDVESDNQLSSTQRRLANIFRPPWDIITKTTLDQAKIQAKDDGKWILINIQDVTDFRCQVLNRDFWSSRQIKNIVEENFIFLQFHHDSPGGIAYRNFYPFTDDEFPHIAILDPITGEQMLKWSEKPEIHQWIDQVHDFLQTYKLHSNNIAPISKGLNKNHAIEIDSDDYDDDDEDEEVYHEIVHEDVNDNQPTVLSEESDIELQPPKALSYSEQINQLDALDIPDPVSNATRIQIRSGIDGKRVVKSLSSDTIVLDLFKFTKYSFNESLNGRPFTLKMQRDNLWDKKDMSVKEAGAAGAALMLEVIDDDDDE